MTVLESVLINLATRIPGATILATGDGDRGWADAVPSAQIVSWDKDGATAQSEIRHVHAVRHGGSGLAAVLDDLGRFLRHSRIDFVLFDGLDVRAEMAGVMARLVPHGYRFFACNADGIVGELRSWMEATSYGHFIAVHQRLTDSFVLGTPKRLDLRALFRRHDVAVAGLIHLGAHEAEELVEYAKIGTFPVTLIEAHPDTYRRLVEKVDGIFDVFPVHAAITDRDGPVIFHISGFAECNSVLPVAVLGQIMPGAAERGTIEVSGRSLDSLLAQWQAQEHKAASANILVSDIQGAELLALKGGTRLLSQLDAVILEVSFDELYAGCGQVEEIDLLMDEAGFTRMATASVQHWSWGDALYVRRRRGSVP